MDRRIEATTLSLLFLLIVAARSSDGHEGHTGGLMDKNKAESSRQNRASAETEQNVTVRDAPTFPTSETNASFTGVINQEKIVSRVHPVEFTEEFVTQQQNKTVGEKEEDDSEEEEEEQEELTENEEEYEGENEDEYEDELKAVAESHEAMSKDDTKNPNVTSPVAADPLIADRSPPAKSFDSHEVTVVNDSDEDVASNEAITDEVVDKNVDEEVAELLKYKKEKNLYDDKTKTKRVPTVKKELSTQKEILIGSNETQVPKSLGPAKDTLNRLNEEIETVKRRNVEGNEAMGLKTMANRMDPQRPFMEGEIAVNNRYSELGSKAERRKKLNKRQETVLQDLKSYLPSQYTSKEEQRQKLRELGAQEDALAENLLKLLVKLVENPGRWERLHKLLMNMENDLKLSRNTLEPSKRGYDTTSDLISTTLPSSENTKKGRKKFKKKKKKPKHRKLTTTTTPTLTTTTMTPIPVTPPLLTTTETPWQTTPVQWRLVAERLFGPPWQQDLTEDSDKGPKVRYTMSTKPRASSLPSIRDLIDQNKSKGNLKPFTSERKSLLTDGNTRELNGQRLLRFGKVNTHQPSHLSSHREFTNVYERPAETEHVPDYDVPDTYPRLRYGEGSAASREFLHRRHEDDYQDDFNLQTDNFAQAQEYRPPSSREFGISKSWPDISYKYVRPWKSEDRSLMSISSGKWPWGQPQDELKYWPQRNKFLQSENRNYWSDLNNSDEETEEESKPEKVWHQQRLPKHTWIRDHANSWSMEKPLKIPATWPSTGRSMKLYDRDQSSIGGWEKSKNNSELSRSSTKDGSKDKVVFQISMKTWNSLTSDPATWPYKLPGAKPWPKDENGKSYNPNADLVKKLGLDKQSNVAWPKEENAKTYEENSGEKIQTDKHNRLLPSDVATKVDEFPQMDSSKYRSNNEKTNPNADYRGRSQSNESIKSSVWSNMMSNTKSTKDWQKSRETEALQNEEENTWSRKYDTTKDSWPSKDTLPKIQSVGAWVMPADQSTWKPYQIKPVDTIDQNTRRWSTSRSNSEENKWPNKDSNLRARSWTEKMNNGNAWMDETSGIRGWNEKSEKTWYAKAKDTWSKSSDSDVWRKKIKGDSSWLSKPNESSSSWPTKITDNTSWATKMKNGPAWSTKVNQSGSWRSDGNDEVSKYNGDSWKESKNDATWKNTAQENAWSRKPSEQTAWTSKSNDLSTWQQKINDEWNYGKATGGSASNWPSKWKQFAYHRVTAMPISKPGTDATASKTKNAFVAVSAVSSPKYGGNEWRKNDEETHNENLKAEYDSGNQLQVGLERPIYTWKKDGTTSLLTNSSSTKSNGTDPLETQLEALRQIDFWPYKENDVEKESTDSTSTTSSSTTLTTNLTTMATDRRNELGKGNTKLLKTHQQAIPMK